MASRPRPRRRRPHQYRDPEWIVERMRMMDHADVPNAERLASMRRLMAARGGPAATPAEVWQRLLFVAWQRLATAHPHLARVTLAEAVTVLLSGASGPMGDGPWARRHWRPVLAAIERRTISPRELQRPNPARVPRPTVRMAYDNIRAALAGVYGPDGLREICHAVATWPRLERVARPLDQDALEQARLTAATDDGIPGAACALTAALIGYTEESVRTIVARG